MRGQRMCNSLLLTICVLVVTPATAELKFDLDGNLLDDGLSRALAHSHEGSDLLIEEDSRTTTTTASSTTITSTQQQEQQEQTPDTPALFDILNESNELVVKNVILDKPESDRVREGSVLKVNPDGGENKRSLRNVHEGSKKENKTSVADKILEDYQYLSYPQEADGKTTETPKVTKARKFLKQVIEGSKDEKSNQTSEGSNNTSTTPSPVEESVTGTSQDSSDEEEEEGEEKGEEEVSGRKSSSIAEPGMNSKHSIDSLVPCSDMDAKACKVFKPLCSIQMDVAFRRCQKTCGFCSGKLLIYEAKISNGLNGLVQFQQSYPGQPVYMTACFEKSSLKGIKTPLAFTIHERKNKPSDEEDSKCSFAGPHWNPYGTLHGNPHSQGYHHQGDLGNIVLNKTSVTPPSSWPENGSTCSESHIAAYETYTHVDLFFNPPQGLLLAVHMKEDDYGHNFFDAKSRKTGKVGEIVACGVIIYKSNTMTDDEEGPSESATKQGIEDDAKSKSGHPGLPKFEKKPGPKVFDKEQELSGESGITSDLGMEDKKDDLAKEGTSSNTSPGSEEDNEEEKTKSSSAVRGRPFASGVREFPTGGLGLRISKDQEEEGNEVTVSVKLPKEEGRSVRSNLGQFIRERAEGLRSESTTTGVKSRTEENDPEEDVDSQRKVRGRKALLNTNLASRLKKAEDDERTEEPRRSIMESKNRDSKEDGEASKAKKSEDPSPETIEKERKTIRKTLTDENISKVDSIEFKKSSKEQGREGEEEESSSRKASSLNDEDDSISDKKKTDELLVHKTESSDEEIKKHRETLEETESHNVRERKKAIDENVSKDYEDSQQSLTRKSTSKRKPEPRAKNEAPTDEGTFTIMNNDSIEEEPSKAKASTKKKSPIQNSSEDNPSSVKFARGRTRRSRIFKNRIEAPERD